MKRALLPISIVVTLVLYPAAADAIPSYTLQSASRCDTCHVEPLGWANPELHRDRRCTLDCQGCHISPTGGGLRTPLGRFYGEQTLPIWTRPPSQPSSSESLLPEGYPSEGRYSLIHGFSGWWPGETEFRTIEDRYGDIPADPVWTAGGDLRLLAIAPTDHVPGRSATAFPMQMQAYVAAQPIPHLTAYLDVGYHGSANRDAERDAIDVFWLREAFVMLNDLDWGAYVRAGRFALPYGWRIPDHTAYTRRGYFDQDRQAYGVEAGVGANYGWGNLAIWGQGIRNWPGDTNPPGAGVTAQGGIRMLGYTLGLSAHWMGRIEDTTPEAMLGPMWGIQLDPVNYLGEMAWRRLGGGPDRQDALMHMHQVRFTELPGLTPKVRWEWEDPDLRVARDERHRLVVGFEFTPVRFLQFDIVYRREWRVDQLDPSEVLVQVHTWLF